MNFFKCQQIKASSYLRPSFGEHLLRHFFGELPELERRRLKGLEDRRYFPEGAKCRRHKLPCAEKQHVLMFPGEIQKGMLSNGADTLGLWNPIPVLRNHARDIDNHEVWKELC